MYQNLFLIPIKINSNTMKNLFLSLSLLFSFFICAQESQAEITFETESIDFGTVTKGSDGLRTFVFTNSGSEPLSIDQVRSSCGCTIPKKPEAPIAPGEKGEIQVRYDTNRLGVFRKTITVTSNAKNKSVVALRIQGTVVETQ
jgi:hypothetical protein